jgi:Peroxidase
LLLYSLIEVTKTEQSVADNVARGTITTLTNCADLLVPLRCGRIDAAGPRPLGVPKPETNLAQTLAEFASARFNVSGAIRLTACGHTLGRVRNGGFPQVVDASAVMPDNTEGGVAQLLMRTSS